MGHMDMEAHECITMKVGSGQSSFHVLIYASVYHQFN